MKRPSSHLLLAAAGVIWIAPDAFAQTTLNASSLVFRSTGTASGANVTLSKNGYLGTYVNVTSPRNVTFTFNASGTADAGTPPRLSLAVADSKTSFSLGATSASYSQTLFLPAGTHFVRAQYDNDEGSTTRAMTLGSLTVSGATVSNVATNALAAADTYVANYRKGNASVSLTGPSNIPLLPGTPVDVALTRHAFSFGTAVPGTSSNSVNSYLGSGNTTKQAQYQDRLRQNFNALVPENAGKWAYNEATRDVETMAAVDQMLNFAQANNMRARMHNLIWGDNSNNGQQPSWVLNNNAAPNNGLLDKAYLGDLSAKNDLRGEITERIASYVGTGGPNDRAKKYYELDVYNESFHTGSGAPAAPTDLRRNYWNVYGAAGVADIYRQTIAAINSSGATAKVFVNEYNVLDDGAYANYYVDHIEAIRRAGIAAGYGDVVQGIGAQYYPSAGTHNASKAMSNFQSLAVQGLPIALTEFGAQSSLSTASGATILGEMLRLTFGNPESTGFFMWGFHQESGAGATTLFAPQSALYTVNTADFNTWTLTQAGRVWQDQLGIADWDGNAGNGWSTNLSAIVAADGTISFNGFYGDYRLGTQANALSLVKGTTGYATQLAAPPTWSLWNASVGGEFLAAGNWSNGAPVGIGLTAHFGAASAPRAVNVASDVVVGQLNFVGNASYTLGGPGRITLDGTAGVAALNVVSGHHQINNPFVASDALLVRIADGASLTLGSDLDAGANTISKSGAGVLAANAIEAGRVEIAAGTVRTRGAVSRADQLQIFSGATLDLVAGAWVIPVGGNTHAESALRSEIVAGRAGGTWLGAGITSSTAAGDPRFAVGIAATADLGSASGWAGFPDSVVVRLTLLGDVDLNGSVDFDDLLVIAQQYEQAGLWAQGDFDYDGVVSFDDLLSVAQNYGSSLWEAHPFGDGADFSSDWQRARSIVPEPTGLALALLGAASRRRR